MSQIYALLQGCTVIFLAKHQDASVNWLMPPAFVGEFSAHRLIKYHRNSRYSKLHNLLIMVRLAVL
jgi:hypothetical protein